MLTQPSNRSAGDLEEASGRTALDLLTLWRRELEGSHGLERLHVGHVGRIVGAEQDLIWSYLRQQELERIWGVADGVKVEELEVFARRPGDRPLRFATHLVGVVEATDLVGNEPTGVGEDRS